LGRVPPINNYDFLIPALFLIIGLCHLPFTLDVV
jgi:hypothetical protein